VVLRNVKLLLHSWENPSLAEDRHCAYNWRHIRGTGMKFIGVRELRNRTGEVLEAVRRGERVILTKRGKPFAAVTSVQEEEIDRLILEGRGWLNLSESSFEFWNNEADEVWNRV